jgi:hypothetical protein
VVGCAAVQASPPHPTPIAGHTIPLLTNTSCYSPAMAASHRSRTSKPSYSPPCGQPLPSLPRLRVVPYLGLAVVHRLGALGMAWSTWSTNDSHWKRTVHGKADRWDPRGPWSHARKCLLIMCKKMIPPIDSWDPSYIFTRKEVPPYYAEKNASSP